jgi:Bacteriophage tail sheath protein
VAQYLAPGVYVEETLFRGKSIEGQSTTTTGFVGPTRRGPVDEAPELITSFGDFARMYGGLADLTFGTKTYTNYMAHAVHAFFNNGGSRLYVGRAFIPNGSSDTGVASSAALPTAGNAADQSKFVARSPGSGGNGWVTILGQFTPVTKIGMDRAATGSMLLVGTGNAATYYLKTAAGGWAKSDAGALDTSTLTTPQAAPQGGAQLLTLTVTTTDGDGGTKIFEAMGLDKTHPRYIGNVLAANPTRRADQVENVYSIAIGSGVDAFKLQAALMDAANADTSDPTVANRFRIRVTSGNDGAEPTSTTTSGTSYSDALELLDAIDDISIVAGPGHSAYGDYQAIQQAIIADVERKRAYRIAVLDASPDQTPSSVLPERSRIDSTHAAFYYPWVIVSNPLANANRDDIPKEVAVPPSGFVSGIYARNDTERSVVKAPANEVVLGALRFQQEVNFAQQEVLNPVGVNCLRTLTNRGLRVWGARTASSDPEWKYVSVRRYFNYLERSIDVGTQWAVFEPNGPKLWDNIRDTVSDFLFNEWKSGALLGESPKQGFFVRCDRSTMDQNDLDNGRLVCLIGVAVVKPAEFVIFRIGQITADARS